MSTFTARQTVGQGGSPVIDQNFHDLETVIKEIQDADPAPTVTVVAKDYGIAFNDRNVFASNGIALTLPDATKMEGRSIKIRGTDATTIRIFTSRGQSVDGSASSSVSSGGLTFTSDGSNWWSG